MSIDLSSERIQTLTQATTLPILCPNGKSRALTTLLRWTRDGIRGHRLETLRIGCTLCTSVEAVERFILRCSAEDQPQDEVKYGSADKQSEGAESPLAVA